MRHASIIGNGMRSRRVPSLLQACSCLPACLLLPVQAASCLPAPHEVGVCHRLCPVSFSNFVCLFGFARLLVSVPSRLRAASCPSSPVPSRLQAASYLLHTKSVFVAGYALCLFTTSCDFPTPWPHPRVTFRGRGRGRACARVVPRVSVRRRARAPAGTPAPQRTCSAGAGFPTPASPAIRT